MNKHQVLSWNIRGATNKWNRMNIKSVVGGTKAKNFFLQETKMQSWEANSIFSLGLGSNVGWI